MTIEYFLNIVSLLLWGDLIHGSRIRLKLARRKKEYKTLMASLSFQDKLFMFRYRDYARVPYGDREQKWISRFNLMYLLYFALLIPCSLVSLAYPPLAPILTVVQRVKIFTLDLIVFFWGIAVGTSCPYGGLEWKFENDYRKYMNKKYR